MVSCELDYGEHALELPFPVRNTLAHLERMRLILLHTFIIEKRPYQSFQRTNVDDFSAGVVSEHLEPDRK
mgnify:CR=1 FL=1